MARVIADLFTGESSLVGDIRVLLGTVDVPEPVLPYHLYAQADMLPLTAFLLREKQNGAVRRA
jgi:hypothetical protein